MARRESLASPWTAGVGRWRLPWLGLLLFLGGVIAFADYSRSQDPPQRQDADEFVVQRGRRRWQPRPRPRPPGRTQPQPPPPQQQQPVQDSYVVLGYNDLGMHCMNADFSQLCILPPYNSLHAQVIRRGREPDIVTRNVTVRYTIPSNTTSVTKTNFWQFAPALFGVMLPPDIGLTGNGLEGVMTPTGNNDWAAIGIPITPIDDGGFLNPYPLASIQVESQGNPVATTRAVVPVSWEISCNLCHAPGGTGPQVDADILLKHDQKHGTSLLGGPPVLCASCHADPALGTTGAPGVSSMSHAMHGSHATRMQPVADMGMTNICYACHPGFQTNCQRDVHFANGIYCIDCHGPMEAVAHPARTPWIDEPTCASCHDLGQEEFDFEEPGKLFKDSRGHGNVHCAACHGSPHAITPALTVEDNIQAIQHQGYPGVIDQCTVCHTSMPGDRFEHKRDD
ncbi:MAG: hypothetical protein CMJ58_28145 [Planctomycetaceae bacterium]|nr:hypothetical protein [Planctomycetaceae bacterium]